MYNSLMADIVTSMQMGGLSKVKAINMSSSKKSIEIVSKLYEMGLIKGFYMKDEEVFVIFKYYFGQSGFKSLSLVSKPSKSVYWSLVNLLKNKGKNESIIYLLSTSKGLLLDSECLMMSVGGEVLLKIEL